MKRPLTLFILLLLLMSFKSELHSKEWYSGIFRVNTTVSSGKESINYVATKAERANLDFIVFSDQFLVHAKYGVWPFRNLISYSKYQPSVVSYGLNRYLQDIEKATKEHPNILLIPGVDIAPHYYWSGSPLSKLTCNQFSEQLTVFGPTDEKFYYNLPVIHNEHTGFDLLEILVDFSPLLLTALGVFFLFGKQKGYYTDRQGNIYGGKKKIIIKIIGLVLIVLSIAWILNNRPFTQNLGFDQYRNYGPLPYQKAIDYVRKTEGDKAGIIWSAPEADMKMNIGNVSLYSGPYLSDLRNTDGYNGFAGIYGDVTTAEKPGKTWDQILLEYCKGTRKTKPVVVGELDYHGKGKRRIDMFQTVVFAENQTRQAIVKAIISGNSHARTKLKNQMLDIQKAELSSDHQTASLGETLTLKKDPSPNQVTLNISGKLIGGPKNIAIDFVVVANGKKIIDKIIDEAEFSLEEKISLDTKNDIMQYVRFSLKTREGNRLLANPIFIKKAAEAQRD